ncbi:MAG: MFS transporter [Janthinobacterium lividum]
MTSREKSTYAKAGPKISSLSPFRAFGNRNYALFFGGQSFSQIGTWMQRTAVSWVVYSTTHSAFMLGLTVFAQQFPSFLLSLVGGIVADRYRRSHILLLTQLASLVQAVLLAILVLTGHYDIWQILTLSVLLGIINAFDVPARQPLVHELVSDPTDLPNALAFNSAMVNVARLLGPALSGLVLKEFGAGICFLINAASFVAVLASLLLLRLPAYVPPATKPNAAAQLAEGFAYLRVTPAISTLLLLLGAISLLVLPYNTLLPVFAQRVFQGDAATFGYVNAFIGLGAVGGTAFLATRQPGTNLKRILLVNTILLGLALILFSCTGFLPLALALAVLAGFGTMSQTTIAFTLVQTAAAAAMRGRVMSYVALVYFGMLPLGSLLIGAISQHIGVQRAMLLQGVVALVLAGAFSNFLSGGRISAWKRN